MKYLLKFIFPFLHSGVEGKRGVGPEFGEKWGMECLWFPLPTLLYAGYNVKLKKINK